MSDNEDVSNLMENLLSEAAGGDSKKAKKSKKELSRKKIVREVRARQQKGKDSGGNGGGGGGKGNGSRDSSSEDEVPGNAAGKNENSASNKEKSVSGGKPPPSDGERKRTKTVVKISTKKISGKHGEQSPASDRKESSKDGGKYVAPVTGDGDDEFGTHHREGSTVVLGRFISFPTFLHRYEQSKGLLNVGPPRFSYTILLRCMNRNSEETKELKMWTTPKLGGDIKGRIERAFQIPKTFQGDLSYRGKTVEDGTSLARLGLRPGGTLEMTYLCEAEVEEVRVVVEWLKFMGRFSIFYHYSVFSGYPKEYRVVTIQGVNECILKEMAEKYLYPSDDKTKYANRVYFLQQNGPNLLLDIYDKMLWQPWRILWLPFKFLEADCIAVLAALGCGQETRKILMKLDAHGYVMQSLLRVPISRFKALEDTSGAPGDQEQKDYILKGLLENVVKFLYNFRDNSEVHMDICSRSSAVDQLIAIAHCPTFSIETAQDCMCVFACCMHSPDVHKYFCRNPTLEGIADCVISRRNKGNYSADQLKLLQYYSQVSLSHLVMSSGLHMSIKAINKIVTFMSDYLKDLDPSYIYKLELEHHKAASWSTFFPYFKPLLSPPVMVDSARCSVDQKLQRALYRDSRETILFALQVMCSGEANVVRRNLMEEKLLGYLFCLPSNVPEELQERARSLCAALRRNSASQKPLPLPKLNVIARAKLAVMTIGLKKVLDRNAKDLKLEVSPLLTKPL